MRVRYPFVAALVVVIALAGAVMYSSGRLKSAAPIAAVRMHSPASPAATPVIRPGSAVVRPPTNGGRAVVRPPTNGGRAVVRPPTNRGRAVVRPPTNGGRAVVRPQVDGHGERSSPAASPVVIVFTAAPSPPANAGLPPGVPYAGNSDPVRIVSIQLSSTVARPGDNISGRVVTSSNAASVTAQIGSIVMPVPKVAPGIFALTIKVPQTLFGLHAVDVIVTAIRSDGATDQQTIPVSLD